MKRIFLFFSILILVWFYKTFAIENIPYLKEYTFLGSIQDEDNNYYNWIKIQIINDWIIETNSKWENCEAISKDYINPSNQNELNKWTFYINCNLKENKSYQIYFSKDWQIIKIIDFITNKSLFTIWKEGYNDILFWLYSKDNSKYLFSEDVQDEIIKNYQIGSYTQDYSKEELYSMMHPKIIEIEFYCKNNRLISIDFNYQVFDFQKQLISEWIARWNISIVENLYLDEKPKTFYYWDWNEKKSIELSYDLTPYKTNIELLNCNEENSKIDTKKIENSSTWNLQNENIIKDYEKEKEEKLFENEESLKIEGQSSFENSNYLEIITPKGYNYIIQLDGWLQLIWNEKKLFSDQYINQKGKLYVFNENWKEIIQETIILKKINDFNKLIDIVEKENILKKISFLIFWIILFLWIVYLLLKSKKRKMEQK